jgi:hypothetical protein
MLNLFHVKSALPVISWCKPPLIWFWLAPLPYSVMTGRGHPP